MQKYFANNAKHVSIHFSSWKAALTFHEPAGFLHLASNAFQQVKYIGKGSSIAEFQLPVLS